MGFVLDASVTIAWAFDAKANPVSQAAWRRCFELCGDVGAPSLWWFEVRNSLIVHERRQRITPARTADSLKALASLPMVLDRQIDKTAQLRCALALGLTAHGAACLEPARRLGLALARLDKALAAAARASGVPPIGLAPA